MNAEPFIVYGGRGTGSVAVEAALTLIGAPFVVVETPPLSERAQLDELATVNPMRQVPALAMPGGRILTESCAILLWLAEAFPEGNLEPGRDALERPDFLQWMAFVSSAIYGLYWIRDYPPRLVDGEEAVALVKARTADRIRECWAVMESRTTPGDYILGDQLTVLDLYVNVVSRWGPRREGFYAAAPRLGACVRRVDDDPRLAPLWRERFARA